MPVMQDLHKCNVSTLNGYREGACLRADQAGHPVGEAELVAHLEALVEGVDVAQVAAGDDHPVGDLRMAARGNGEPQLQRNV